MWRCNGSGRSWTGRCTAQGRRATIVGATSGDTGAAAIEAFRGLDSVDVFILYPHERVSEVQRRQMTGVPDANVHVIALEGTFDDAQAILKGLFRNTAFRDDLGLAGVNSINWARVLAQVVYYFTAAASLGAPHRAISFSVPTGNFGDIFAAWIAKRMGLPIARLVIATNENDILARTLETGRYEVRGVTPTLSPSMDIQVSSNFERLLFDATNRDAAAVRRMMASLDQSRAFTLDPPVLDAIRADFDAERVSEAQTRAEIAADMERLPHRARSAHGGRGRGRAARPGARPRDARRRRGDRASREIPRRRHCGDGPASRAAAASRRSSRTQGTLRHPPERHKRRRDIHPRARDTMTIRTTALPSGLRVVTDSRPETETVALTVNIAAGSRHESEAEHGLAHLLEHMAFKGTRSRTARAIAEEIESVGGDINAATATEQTSYMVRILPENMGLAVELLADILLNSTFDPDELAAREGRHPAGDRRGGGHAGRSGFRPVRRDGFS